MSFSIAIVGLPNVGKSTLFNALLKRQVALAANYPFATIEPNHGIAEVPDERLAVLAKIVGTNVLKPATVEFVDVAGLVKGASQGEGLGNQFLAHIRECKVICHVLRDFNDEQVLRAGSLNPKEDLLTIRTELQLADLQTLKKQSEPKGSTNKAEKIRWQIIGKFKEILENGISISSILAQNEPSEEEAKVAEELCLLTAKKEIFVINTAEEDLAVKFNQLAVKKEKSLIQEYQKWAQTLGVAAAQIVFISAKIESELSALSETDQQAYLQELGLKKSGLERLATVAYQTLNLQSFLTAGVKEVRAWTVPIGISAVKAAAVIHSDFEKNFIKAKVVNYNDFVACQGWQGAKQEGKLRLEGRDYVLGLNDVIEFMIGK